MYISFFIFPPQVNFDLEVINLLKLRHFWITNFLLMPITIFLLMLIGVIFI